MFQYVFLFWVMTNAVALDKILLWTFLFYSQEVVAKSGKSYTSNRRVCFCKQQNKHRYKGNTITTINWPWRVFLSNITDTQCLDVLSQSITRYSFRGATLGREGLRVLMCHKIYLQYRLKLRPWSVHKCQWDDCHRLPAW